MPIGTCGLHGFVKLQMQAARMWATTEVGLPHTCSTGAYAELHTIAGALDIKTIEPALQKRN